MSYTSSARKDVFFLFILILTALLIFYPVFYTEYAYTDELVGLWQWQSKIGDSSGTLLQYGRYITGKLAEALFGSVSTIKELTWIRLFSFGGWLLSIPVWYRILKEIIQKEKLPSLLTFFSVLYLICTPSVAISIGWAACFEMWLANTLGLLSGYFLYKAIGFEDNRIKISGWLFILSLIAGLFCLFTYQNCFGCFLIPFLITLISSGKLTRNIYIGILVYFLIYAVYYGLFKYMLRVNHISETVRTGLHINVGNKLPFFLLRPLNSVFHFTYIFNENNIAGIIIYLIIAAIWLFVSFLQRKEQDFTAKVKYFLIVFCILGLIYLPSLVVKENYASSRTMFALCVAVFILVAETFLSIRVEGKKRSVILTILSLVLVVNAWYNFNKQYLQPVAKEYNDVRKFIESKYQEGIDTVYFIRPSEDFFVKQYNITRSWDEFGVPSTFFEWTPEFLVRQVILEKTGKREIAEKLSIKSWPGEENYKISVPVTDTLSSKKMVVNVGEILSK
ncbi:MAG: hypothetical protein JSS70_13960 [Bacteroidetes bacterium]|nr:hypothetical protein [Bacteroidota bacterium]